MSCEELLKRHAEDGAAGARTRGEGAAAVPTEHTVVITCMDARIDPAALFGIAPGEVHVLRNAGGVVTDDVLRSVAISQRKLGTRDVLLVAHSGCGLATFTDDEFGEELAREVGMRPAWHSRTFADPATNVQRDVARLRQDPFLLPDTRVRGFVLDITSFDLDEVAAEG